MRLLAAVIVISSLWACGGRARAPASPSPGAADDASTVGRPFDLGAAEAALDVGAANATRTCPQPGTPGIKGDVEVTFSPVGDVTAARTKEPWGETPIGLCVITAFAALQVPPFDGQAVTLKKGVDVP